MIQLKEELPADRVAVFLRTMTRSAVRRFEKGFDLPLRMLRQELPILALGRVVSPPVRRETYENYSANYAYMCVYFTI